MNSKLIFAALALSFCASAVYADGRLPVRQQPQPRYEEPYQDEGIDENYYGEDRGYQEREIVVQGGGYGRSCPAPCNRAPRFLPYPGPGPGQQPGFIGGACYVQPLVAGGQSIWQIVVSSPWGNQVVASGYSQYSYNIPRVRQMLLANGTCTNFLN